MTKLLQVLSALSVFVGVGAASASEVLSTAQLDEITAGGVATANATAYAHALSLTAGNVSASTSTLASAFEGANDAVHAALAGSASSATAGN